jgi:glutathione synthase/RimK-type ligase-like ATP-grasp enzyme
MYYILRRRGLGKTSCDAIAANSKHGIQVVRNDQGTVPNDAKLIIRWGCTSNVPRGATILNKVKSIHWVSNKAQSRVELQEVGIPVPRTLVRDEKPDPKKAYIVRPEHHHQGRNLFLCRTAEEINEAVEKCGFGAYISEYIPKIREYRVYVVNGRVAAVAEKIPEDPKAIGWNHALGATFNNVKWRAWPIAGCQLAIAAAKVSGLDFTGVDIMEGPDHQFYVLELNSAPSLTSGYRQKVFAKVFDWIIEEGNEYMDYDVYKPSWKTLIHPALMEK